MQPRGKNLNPNKIGRWRIRMCHGEFHLVGLFQWTKKVWSDLPQNISGFFLADGATSILCSNLTYPWEKPHVPVPYMSAEAGDTSSFFWNDKVNMEGYRRRMQRGRGAALLNIEFASSSVGREANEASEAGLSNVVLNNKGGRTNERERRSS